MASIEAQRAIRGAPMPWDFWVLARRFLGGLYDLEGQAKLRLELTA
jgi:hypothetical protein